MAITTFDICRALAIVAVNGVNANVNCDIKMFLRCDSSMTIIIASILSMWKNELCLKSVKCLHGLTPSYPSDLIVKQTSLGLRSDN